MSPVDNSRGGQPTCIGRSDYRTWEIDNPRKGVRPLCDTPYVTCDNLSLVLLSEETCTYDECLFGRRFYYMQYIYTRLWSNIISLCCYYATKCGSNEAVKANTSKASDVILQPSTRSKNTIKKILATRYVMKEESFKEDVPLWNSVAWRLCLQYKYDTLHV